MVEFSPPPPRPLASASWAQWWRPPLAGWRHCSPRSWITTLPWTQGFLLLGGITDEPRGIPPHVPHLGPEAVVPPHFWQLEAPGQETHLVPSIGLLQDLVEHLYASHLAHGSLVVAEHLHLLPYLQLALLQHPGDQAAPVWDGLVLHTLNQWTGWWPPPPAWASCPQEHRGQTLGQYEPPHLLQQLPDLHIQQLDHLLVSSIALVDEDHQVLEAQLLREGKMLPRDCHTTWANNLSVTFTKASALFRLLPFVSWIISLCLP